MTWFVTVVITQVVLHMVLSSLSIFTRRVCGSVPNSSTGTLFMISRQDRGYECTHRRRATLSSRLRKIERRGVGKKKSNTLGVFFFPKSFSPGVAADLWSHMTLCAEGGVKNGYTDGPAGGSIVYPHSRFVE